MYIMAEVKSVSPTRTTTYTITNVHIDKFAIIYHVPIAV